MAICVRARYINFFKSRTSKMIVIISEITLIFRISAFTQLKVNRN